ncbi:MAG TPA: prephenate dehydratase [archaeon]|nr:prephenate dehydratase [archaeon]
MSSKNKIDALRKKIDQIDIEISKLLKKRAEIAKNAGKIKKLHSIPIRDLEREKAVLNRMSDEAKKLGLESEDVKAVYKEIMALCRRLEGEETKVAFLGPHGTFAEEAAHQFFPSAGTDFIQCTSTTDVFREVESGIASYGVVPVESSAEGAVPVTLDQLLSSSLMVCGEIELQVRHNLIVPPKTNLAKIKKIISHPQGLAQCRRYLEEHFPGVELKEESSTAKAVQMASKLPNTAAIGTELAAEIYGMKIAAKNIQDNPRNYTRFFILAKTDNPRTGRDKTSIIFAVKHVPGALYKALEEFASRNLNITKIESRPTKQKQWEYVFFLDFEGHKTDKACKEALEGLKKNTLFIKILGSYPEYSTK